jgi:putative tricarboxylic transport membrane protein
MWGQRLGRASGPLVAGGVLVAVVLCGAGGLAAPAWQPARPVEFVAPYAPGGGSDVLARTIASIVEAERLSPVPLVVVNRVGGGGTVGTTYVAGKRGNPHTLLTFISGQVSGALVARGAATWRDLTLIARLAIDEELIYVKADSPFRTLRDVVAAAQQRPGAVTIAGTATGQEDHMVTRLFERAAGIRLRYVPFQSGGEVMAALMGGQVDMAWANPNEAAPQWEARQVRALAVAREARLPDMPDVPTFREQGYDVTFEMFRGVAAPPDLPPAAVAFYETMLRRMTESARWKDGYLRRYMLTDAWMGSREFTAFVARQEEMFRRILRELGLIQ